MKSRPYGDRHFQVSLHSDRPDTRIHLARPQAQEMTFHISQSQCWEASKSQLVTMTSEICLPRSLTSVSSSTAQKVRSRQHFPRRIKEQLRTLIFVIYWFSHYCNFIETNISSFIIMSYHKIYSSGFIFIHHQFRKRPRLQWLCSLFSLFSAPRSFPGYSFRADDFPRRDRTRTIVLRWMMNLGASIWFS